MGQEFGISVSRNLSINPTLPPTGRSVSLYMLPFLFGGGLKFGSYGYFCIILVFPFSSLSFSFLSPLLFFSFNKNQRTYIWVFLHIVLALLPLTPGAMSS